MQTFVNLNFKAHCLTKQIERENCKADSGETEVEFGPSENKMHPHSSALESNDFQY